MSAEAGAELDPRCFRMLFQVDGCEAHEEDGWVGGAVTVGDSVEPL